VPLHSIRVFAAVAPAALLLVACDPGRPFSADERPTGPPAFDAVPLSSYFPPAESQGGWRKTTDAGQILSLGIDAAKLADLGSYLTTLPSEAYATGVSGYNAKDKAAIVIKGGWIVGEYYNQPSAASDVYFLASNGKSFSIMLAGRMVRDFPQLGIGLDTKFYDPRWLPQGFPLSDPRKADITFDQVFRHVSGVIPEVENPVAEGSTRPQTNWTFPLVTVGKDADYPVTAPLYYTPGDPSTYTKGSTYSSVAFNHFSLIFRNVTGLEASVYFRQAILDPIGVGRMAYKAAPGLGDFVWATAGNGLTSARDFARIGYLMLHEGDWNGTELVPQSWLRQFTTSPAYRNIRSNVDCRWGNKFPSDMYRTTGSGQNWVLVVPSLDMVLTFTGRTPKSLANAIDTLSLKKLFAAVTDRYVACDGTVINANPPPPPPSNSPPSAAFTTGCTVLDCDFTDHSSDQDGTVSSWSWDFGDGDGSTESSPSHAFAAEGGYTVTLAVTDDDGATTSTSRAITVSGENIVPTADFTSSCTGLVCDFTDRSTDPDGDVVGWSWTFGDGATSTARNPSRTYASEGTYDVKLTVTDNGGATQEHTASVTVSSAPPPPPPPPPPTIVLSATGKEDATKQYMILRWSGASGSTVDIYRNGVFQKNTENDGKHTITKNNFTGPATYLLKVCQASTTTCSNVVTLVFD
jgi:PKD repeat protein/CubicO group peptidase (beta-lactamase class C family)